MVGGHVDIVSRCLFALPRQTNQAYKNSGPQGQRVRWEMKDRVLGNEEKASWIVKCMIGTAHSESQRCVAMPLRNRGFVDPY